MNPSIDSRRRGFLTMIGWKSGIDICKYAEGLKSPGLRKIIDDHYFKKDVLAHPRPGRGRSYDESP
jgi:hypothetical protein